MAGTQRLWVEVGAIERKLEKGQEAGFESRLPLTDSVTGT